MKNNLLDVINVYEPIIKQFKKRSDVLNGWGIAWKSRNDLTPKLENVPFSIGDGLGTTGWCVSASEALLYDKVFQTNLGFRKAKAKLISIDIKEQYYGFCYNGSQNKWHTAILLEDSGFKIVIDITCRQFGNDFIEKDIWDFETWQSKLRSPFCTHLITDFDNNPELIQPITVKRNRNLTFDSAITFGKLKDVTTITDNERNLLVEFGLKKINLINDKLLLKNVTKNDLKYINDLSKLLMSLPFKTLENGYSVLAFETKKAAKNWIELFLKNETCLIQYLLVSKSLSDSCKLNDIDINNLNQSKSLKPLSDKTFVVFEFSNLFGINSEWLNLTEIILPYGIELLIEKDNIFNSGKLIAEGVDNVTRETNTIIIKVENM
jgi:hypothetical protein